MSVQVHTIMLGVDDMARARRFYGEGLGCTILQDQPQFVSFSLGDASSSLALYPRQAAARDAGVSAEGSGFRGFSMHHIVATRDEVDRAIDQAAAAGGTVVQPASGTGWGYFGYFADPDGYLWKVASAS